MTRVVAVVVAVFAAATTARAQGFSFTPSFGIVQLYDDNVFYLPHGESDTVTRANSRLEAGYRSERLTFWSRYGLDSDRFDRHPELTTAHARQDAGLEHRYQASRRLSFTGAASYVETEAPAELNVQSALAPGRSRAQRTTIHPSMSYQAGPSTTATFGYTVSGDRLLGVQAFTQAATASVEHRQSARDTVRVDVTHQQFVFNQQDRQMSQALTAEWTRDLTRGTTIAFRGGPRLTAGSLSSDVAASLRRKTRAGETSISYEHTQASLIGLVGVADTHSLTAGMSSQPRQGLRFRLAPGLLRTTQMNLASTVYRLSAGYSQDIGARVLFEAAYELNLQRGNIYTSQSIDTIRRHVAMVRLVATSTPARRQ